MGRGSVCVCVCFLNVAGLGERMWENIVIEAFSFQLASRGFTVYRNKKNIYS